MKFNLADKFVSIEPGKRIVTVKALSLAEEYLQDHFPSYPILPGVLMLEAMTQAAAWLTRLEQDYARSVIVLQTARNVRYANMVQPGDQLTCEVDAVEISEDSAKFKGLARVGDRQTVSGKLELMCFNVADRYPHLKGADEEIIKELKLRFDIAGGPKVLAEPAAEAGA